MTYIISEICGQWGGSVRKAEQMILQSKMAGADAVKVQLYDTYKMPGDNRQLWEYLSMRQEDFHRLADFCERLNIDFFASAFDKERFDWIKNADLKINKIASSLIVNDPSLCKEMLDSGMKTFFSLGKWDKEGLPFEHDNVVYFHCYAKYPHTLQEAMEIMPSTFQGKLLGYSDHSLGIEAAKEAVRRGARYVEKHYTLNKNDQSKTEGAHLCSMDMKELQELREYCDSHGY
jgi:N,N'-diacetyllegionaminate synthase